jgi:hypothetical protein
MIKPYEFLLYWKLPIVSQCQLYHTNTQCCVFALLLRWFEILVEDFIMVSFVWPSELPRVSPSPFSLLESQSSCIHDQKGQGSVKIWDFQCFVTQEKSDNLEGQTSAILDKVESWSMCKDLKLKKKYQVSEIQ